MWIHPPKSYSTPPDAGRHCRSAPREWSALGSSFLILPDPESLAPCASRLVHERVDEVDGS
jgi:hypothetical protein